MDAFRSEGTQVKYLYNGMGQRVGIEKKMAAGAEGSTVTRMDYIPDLTRGYHNMLQERREDADGKVISVKNFLWDEGLIAMDSLEICSTAYGMAAYPLVLRDIIKILIREVILPRQENTCPWRDGLRQKMLLVGAWIYRNP